MCRKERKSCCITEDRKDRIFQLLGEIRGVKNEKTRTYFLHARMCRVIMMKNVKLWGGCPIMRKPSNAARQTERIRMLVKAILFTSSLNPLYSFPR